MSKVRMGKAIVKSFDDIAGYIEKSMHRGMKSPNHLQTTTLKDGGFLQTKGVKMVNVLRSVIILSPVILQRHFLLVNKLLLLRTIR